MLSRFDSWCEVCKFVYLGKHRTEILVPNDKKVFHFSCLSVLASLCIWEECHFIRFGVWNITDIEMWKFTKFVDFELFSFLAYLVHL